MGNVHFSGQHRDIPSYALNSPRDNVLESKNIRFHIGGQYLTDLSDKGIKRFIEKNYNDKTGFLGGIGLGWGGKDLEFKEVKAFIQAAAANADKLQGMSFDLTDPQLGLFDDDDVKVDDIRHSFNMEYKPVQGTSSGTSAGEVSFVEATKVRYDMREARSAETKAQDAFKGVQSSHRDLQKNLQSAIKDRDRIASRIGDNAVQRLAEIDGKLKSFESDLGSINKDISSVRQRLTQDHVPESERRELRLTLRGMESEKKDLEDEYRKMKKELSEKHGFWSFLGGGSTMEDLRRANAKVESAQRAVEQHRPELEASRNRLQDAVRRREAVERGESLSDLDAAPPADEPSAPSAQAATPAATPGAPAGTPERPAAADNTAAPTAPAADGTPIGEQHLQRIIALPADQQTAALAQIPESDRQAFLGMTDEYLYAGRAENPLGLKAEDHEPIVQQRETLAKLRLNGLLSWGENAQKSYLERVDGGTKNELLAQLEQNLFDQQLSAQAQALRDRLKQATAEVPVPPSAETPVTPAAQAAVPAQPGQTAQPPAADALLGRFTQLEANEQDAFFSAQTLDQKGQILMGLAQLNFEDQATRERLSKLMSPDDKQTLVNQLAAIRDAQGSTPHPRNTELNMLLGMFANQGVTPKATAPAPAAPAPEQTATVQTEAVPVQPATVQAAPAPETAPLITEEAPAQPAAQPVQRPAQQAAAQPAQKPKPKPQAQAAQPAKPAQQPAAAANKPVTDAEVEWAQTWAAKVEKGEVQPSDADKARYEDIFRRAQAEEAAAPAAAAKPTPTAASTPAPASTAAQAKPNAAELAKELEQMDANSRMQGFASLNLEGKRAVFPKLSQGAQVETLLALAFDASFEADRKGLIAGLDAGTKQKLAKAYNEGLPAAEIMKDEAPDLAPAMRKIIQELGAKVQPPVAQSAAPAQASVGQAAPNMTPKPVEPVQSVQPTMSTAAPQSIVEPPAAPPPGRIDMKAQINQLSNILKEKSYFGMGGVSNAAGMQELVGQIWGMGTDKNINDMAKLLVAEGQSQVLANVLVNEGVQADGIMKVMGAPGFPVKTFMNKVDDSRAYLMLQSLSEIATRKDASGQRAQAMIVETVDAYKSGWDREEPFKRMKTAAQASGHWQQLPKAVRDKIDGMLNSFWN